MVDANGIVLAAVFCRDDLQKWSFGHSRLTSDEARRIANAIAHLPEFLMQRQGFYSKGGGDRWKPSRPYHVALEDSYVRAHWDEIDALCKLNSIPFNATGEKIRDNGLWCVYEFTWQSDAIQFWDRFDGRWLRGSEFHYPERPKDLPPMKPLKNWPKFDPRNARGRASAEKGNKTGDEGNFVEGMSVWVYHQFAHQQSSSNLRLCHSLT